MSTILTARFENNKNQTQKPKILILFWFYYSRMSVRKWTLTDREKGNMQSVVMTATNKRNTCYCFAHYTYRYRLMQINDAVDCNFSNHTSLPIWRAAILRIRLEGPMLSPHYRDSGNKCRRSSPNRASTSNTYVWPSKDGWLRGNINKRKHRVLIKGLANCRVFIGGKRYYLLMSTTICT